MNVAVWPVVLAAFTFISPPSAALAAPAGALVDTGTATNESVGIGGRGGLFANGGTGGAGGDAKAGSVGTTPGKGGFGGPGGLGGQAPTAARNPSSTHNTRATLTSVGIGFDSLLPAGGWVVNRRSVVHNARINIALTALTADAAILIAASVVSRGRVALVLLSAGLFSVLAILAIGINAHWMTAPDTWVWNWFNAHRSPRWQVHADGIFGYIGRPFHVAAAGVISGTLLAVLGRSAMRAVLVIATVGAGAVAEQMLKAVVERTPANLAQLHDGSLLSYAHSFPSGHVTGSATLLGTIAVCLGTRRSRAVKATLAVLVAAGVLFVAFLALYSRAHIFTDVIGGMVLGGALVALGTAALLPSARRDPTTAADGVRPADAWV